MRRSLLATAFLVSSTLLSAGLVASTAGPAAAYCVGIGSPDSINAAQGRESNQASEPCNGNGVYGGRAMDVQVGDGHCTYIYYRYTSGGGSWVQGTGCSTTSWTNYGANGTAFWIRACVGNTGICTAERLNQGF